MNCSQTEQVEVHHSHWEGHSLSALSILESLETIRLAWPVRDSCPSSVFIATGLVSLGSVAGFFIALQL
jgi:hypothetical protein